MSLETGVADVVLKPDNSVTLKQFHDAVAKNGFTMKNSVATIAGTVQVSGANVQLLVTGSNDVLKLEADSDAAPIASDLNGKAVTVEGVIPQAERGQSPKILKYQKVEVQQ